MHKTISQTEQPVVKLPFYFKFSNSLLGKPLLGTAILSVFATGDFDNKNRGEAKRIADIYERLSKASGGLVPKAFGYIFDREDRQRIELSRIEKQYKNVYFTPRRMYENYLLNPKAIVSVIKEINKDAIIDIVKVEEVIE